MQYELKRLHQASGHYDALRHPRSAEAMTMSDRVAVFSAGRIQQLTDPRTLYEQPANAFVRSSSARTIGWPVRSNPLVAKGAR